MENILKERKAVIKDLPDIICLLNEDELGKTRENLLDKIDQKYIDAFALIEQDPNQYLMVVERNNNIIATCHLTIMPSLTFIGSTRIQIEAVRVCEELRGQKIGEWMINKAVEYAKFRNASILQLTTNIKRSRARIFYERLGFEATHTGMKMHINKS